MPRHMRFLAFAVATVIAGSTLGSAQAADPVRIPDANPAVTRDLSGHVTKAQDMRALPAAPGQELKGVAPDSRVMPIHPSDADRKAGGAFRTPEKAGGTVTPIGTLNIVRGEQLRAPVVNTIAERPSQRTDGRF
ncbi:MAG TPA: hypothetical protein VJR58_17290 [Vineibacter sp.]|nr:hypothetical protein [Vineibacter sp.]